MLSILAPSNQKVRETDYFKKLDIESQFDAGFLARGHYYYLNGHVLETTLEERDPWVLLSGTVFGNHKHPYQVDIKFKKNVRIFSGDCSCPVGYNCKHVVAVLYAVLSDLSTSVVRKSPIPKITAQTVLNEFIPAKSSDGQNWHEWTSGFKNMFNKNFVEATPCVYILDIKPYHNRNYVTLQLWDQNNTPLNVEEYVTQNYAVAPDTLLMLHLQDAARSIKADPTYNDFYTLPLLNNTTKLLKQLLKSEACYWQSKTHHPISIGNPRKGKLMWQQLESGKQKLIYKFFKENVICLPMSPLWYFDQDRMSLGLIQTDLNPDLVVNLLQAPILFPEETKNIINFLKNTQKSFSTDLIPLPRVFDLITTVQSKPIPHLSLFGRATKSTGEIFALAQIIFKYDDVDVVLSMQEDKIRILKNNEIFMIERNLTFEQNALDTLIDQGFMPLCLHFLSEDFASKDRLDFLIDSSDSPEKLLELHSTILPTLRQQGWEIIVEDTFPLHYVEEPEEWYSQLEEEKSEYDWFKLELGVIVDNKPVNVLPLLTQLIHNENNDMSYDYVNSLPDEHVHLIKMPDNRYFPIANQRIKGILFTLTELYDSETNNDSDHLFLSELRALQLAQLQKLMGAARLRWLGPERIRVLGEKLANFKGIQNSPPSKSFQGKLRPYQQEGLNWLNFLREFELGGILADDMGLGKTIQVLALLQKEKELRRTNKPSLIIAPTSLMHNWKQEATRFTPNLKVLILQGPDRHQFFEELHKFDIILSTYPLVVRDKQYFLNQEYHYLILDEAHNIKNLQAKATAALHEFKAKHRLCLTGTPMENHLGELWSLFHFVLPGLLGEYRQFITLFKNPIEKENNVGRRISLSNRIMPFMLRRVKEMVVKELPGKTELIETIEFNSHQNDLYESIRIAMEKKIRSAIQSKGLKRSHIIILDALLKLRQTCNDPRLLKLKEAKKVKNSSKLSYLMKLLEKLILQNKRILVFSSFASMLAIIKQELTYRNISHCLLTGSTQNRLAPVKQFQSGEVPIFLISLKAGGVGLNLTAADTVIHYDPWWNPAAEEQATDRAHRIGQDKHVTVYKLIIKGSIEEKILTMQKKKQALVEALFDTNSNLSKGGKKFQLVEQDLTVLFQPIN